MARKKCSSIASTAEKDWGWESTHWWLAMHPYADSLCMVSTTTHKNKNTNTANRNETQDANSHQNIFWKLYSHVSRVTYHLFAWALLPAFSTWTPASRGTPQSQKTWDIFVTLHASQRFQTFCASELPWALADIQVILLNLLKVILGKWDHEVIFKNFTWRTDQDFFPL